jgi:hypothetical protein
MRLVFGIIFCTAASAQTVAILSPADGATIQAVNLTNGRELSITSTVTEGSGYKTVRVCATMNDRPVNPQNCSYAAPWTIKAYPGLPGDGDQVYQFKSYDRFGNVLATSATATIHARMTGMPSSLTVSGTSGLVNVVVTEYNGTNLGGGCTGALSVDGRALTVGVDYASSACTSVGITYTGLDSTKLRNGKREIFVALNDPNNSLGGDPYIASNTFTFAGSPSTLTLTGPNDLVTNRPVAVTSSGTVPTQLTSGAIWGSTISTTSPTNLVVSDICASASCVVTLNASPGVSIGGSVDIRNVVMANVEQSACEGPFTVTAAAGNTFTVSAPGCPDGTALAGRALTVVTNPTYAIWLSATTIQLAATPNGAPLTLSGGSGTFTIAGRVSNGYWAKDLGNDGIEDGYQLSFARAVVDFENMSVPMEIRPPHSQIEGVVGAVIPECPKLYNTDLTFSSPTCTSVTYQILQDGGFTGVATVDASGNVTLAGAGYAKLQETLAPYAVVTITIHAYSGAVTFNHHTHDGHIATAYTPGQSFIPTSMWYLDPCFGASRSPSWTQLMFETGLNTCFTGGFVTDYTDPKVSSCPVFPDATNIYMRSWADAWKTKYGTPVSFEMDISNWTFGTNGYLNMYAFAYNIGYNRQTCIQAALANIKTDARTFGLFGFDEVSAAVGGSFPNVNPAVGSANFTNIVVAGGAGAATANVLTTFIEGNWNQATGIGGAVHFSGATNACLNGWKLITGSTPCVGTYGSGTVCALTFSTICGNGTYDHGTDSGLTMDYFPETQVSDHATDVPAHACTLPKYVGSVNNIFQGWSNVYQHGLNAPVSDTSMTNWVCNGTTCTINNTANGFANGYTVWVSGAGTAALNGMWPYTVVNANSGTIPSTAAAGTYNATSNANSDANLLIAYDCAIPATYLTTLFFTFQAGANIALRQPVIGGLYGFGPAIGNWNSSTVMNSGLLYHAQQEPEIYGESGSCHGSQLSSQQSGLTTRAYQLQARGDLVGWHGMQYLKRHTGYLFDPALDNPNNVSWTAGTQVCNIMSSVTWGLSSFRYAWFQSNNAGQYLNGLGTFGGGNAMGPENATAWKGAAHAFQHLQHMTKYYLQPHCNSPYYGPMFNTLCTVAPDGSTTLTVVYLGDGGSTYPMTVDLSAIRQPSGSSYNSSLTGYREVYAALAGNPTTDAHTFTPAETVTYVAQPSGAIPDLTSITFIPPNPLPFGAVRYGVQIGYYQRDVDDDPVTDCTAACNIGIHLAGGPAWYRPIYADASWKPLNNLAAVQPVMIPAR